MQTAKHINRNMFSLKQSLNNSILSKMLSPGIAFAEHLFKLRTLESFYEKILEKEEGSSFIDTVLDVLNIRYEVSELDLYRIPREGALIVTANHPFGAIDGMPAVPHIRTEIPRKIYGIKKRRGNVSDMFKEKPADPNSH
jgi:putative hemolysin